MKKKVKVYQVQRLVFDEKGNILPKDERKNRIVCIGTVILPKTKKESIEESIWDLFNWTCWGWGKLTSKSWIYGIRNGIKRDGYRMFPNKNAMGYCNSDIFFELDGKWMVALSCGWSSVDSYNDAVNMCIKNQRY